MMDIDRILKQAVDKDNKQENLANFNRSAGVRESLNENLIPEQLFDDPNTKEKEAEGISAVKAFTHLNNKAIEVSCRRKP